MTDRGPVLVVNAGTTSVKCSVFTRTDDGPVETHRENADVADGEVAAALDGVLDRAEAHAGGRPSAVAHRVVHGAELYTSATLVTDQVERDIDDLSALAPLHNPVNLAGIRASRRHYPSVPQVAVFDTAFHATLPPATSTYAIPQDLARRHRVRRWGFQGTSCAYVVAEAASYLGRPVERVQVLVAHLGGGASVTAVRDGASVDTSMGMTPLEGLVMGTRSGDVDPSVVAYLVAQAGLDPDQVIDLLNHGSGLRGLAGTSDMREVRRRARDGEPEARLALDVYTQRLRRYVAGQLSELPALDAIVFTGGVGQHDPALRAETLAPLRHLGFRLDHDRNAAATAPTTLVAVNEAGAAPAILVVPTDEELQIARETVALLDAAGAPG